ncbi:PKD domain-containing protein [Chitinophaga arvensicola]|uniref:Right handed beta helix region n=1 Tax=Chitinophaga arvensicola TaxID=29529 RepID=A0A1I0QWW9_9BACT|nr:right-handed parallel beta-helix repeat-containing protein [Chitinophaga arvensicola]SEW32016.1 Right handed beta helix region [Chitinophaga arvensicola]
MPENESKALLAAGTPDQYWRGDETWQTLDKNAVGLSQVDNTSDAAKPVSTATQTALNGKAAANHTHVIADIIGLQNVLTGLQQQIDALAPAPATLIVSAGADQAINLPVSNTNLTATAVQGIANSWLWEQVTGPINNGVNYDRLSYTHNPARTFTILPDAQGRALLNFTSGGYQPGDLILLKGTFKSVGFENFQGTLANPIFVQNVEGEVVTIGEESWNGGSYAAALNLSNCKHMIVWGTDVNSFLLKGSLAVPAREAYKNIICEMYTDNVRIAYLTSTGGGTPIWCKKEVVLADTNSWGTSKRLENIRIDNCIIHDNYNEGMYIGHTAPYWDTQAPGTGAPYYPNVGEVPDPVRYKVPIRINNVRIHHCLLYNIGGDGIQVAGSDDVKIYNNEIRNHASRNVWSDNGGIIWGGVTNWEITNNYIHDSWGDLLQCYASSSGVIKNNLLVRGQNEGISLRVEGPQTVTIEDNTIADVHSSCVRVNGFRGGTAPVLLNRNILAKWQNVRAVYVENGGAVTEGTNANANTEQATLTGLDVNNYYLPASGVNGFRIGTEIIGIGSNTGAVIVSPNSQNTAVTGLIKGTYTFKVTGTPSTGSPASDTVNVVVNDAVVIVPPTANAGVDQTTGSTTVTLNGAGSTTPNGTIQSYLWEKVSGPAAGVITNATAVSTTVTGLTTGVYVFRLTVTDSIGQTASDTVQITKQAVTASQWFSSGGPNNNVYDTATNSKCWIYLPAGYDPAAAEKLPAIIFLHGDGGMGTDINNVLETGLPQLINAGQAMNSVVICPQAAFEHTAASVKKAYDYLLANFNVDPNRISGTGLSSGAGGIATFIIAYPSLLTSYILSSIPANNMVANAATIKDIPGMIVVGLADTQIGVQGSNIAPIDALVAQQPFFPPLTRLVFGGGHNAELWNGKLYNKATAGFDFEKDILQMHSKNKEQEATFFVVRAETSSDYNDYLEAVRVVGNLTASSTKTALQTRLATVYTNITPAGTRRVWLDFGSSAQPVTGNFNKITNTANNGAATTGLIDATGAVTGLSFKPQSTQWDTLMPGLAASYKGLPTFVYADGRRLYGFNDWRIQGANNSKKYDIRFLYCYKTDNTSAEFGFKATIGGNTIFTHDDNYNTLFHIEMLNVSPVAGEIVMQLEGRGGANDSAIMAILLTEKD